MKPKSWLLVIMTAAIFFASCKNRNEVKLLTETFPTEIAEQQNLTFRFNKPLRPDSLLALGDDTTHYIEFSPAVAGIFRWNSAKELTFSPAAGFEPGTEYTATLRPALLAHARKGLRLAAGASVHFHTSALRVDGVHFGYARGQDGGAVQTVLDISFNYEVNLSTAAARLALRSRGNGLRFNSTSSGNGKTLSIQFAPLTEKDEEVPVEISIEKGITMVSGAQSASRDTVFRAMVPSRMVMQVTGMEPSHDGAAAAVLVHTTQPVPEESLKSFVTIEPAAGFEVETVDGGFFIRSTAMKAEEMYQLTVSGSLTGAFGGRMKSSFSEQIVFPKPEPAISFANEKGLYLSGKGYRNLELRLVSVPEVQVIVTKVYENNILHSLRPNYRYNEEDEEEESNGYYYSGSEEAADTVFSQRYQTDKLPRLNSSRLLHLDFRDRIKGYSGIYVISVASTEDYWVREKKVLCLSDIGLIVKEEADKMYVFANSIRYATPMAGAEISVISRSNQKLYTGRTNAEGVAAFDRTASRHPGMHTGMVTARSGDDFSFVWLENSRVETSRFELGGRQPNATGMNAWIYAERNLYRPGETAHVGVVVRDESWKTPATVPIKVKLLMPNGRELSGQRTVLQKDGSADLAFPIPPAAATGTYTVQVFSGSDVLLNSYDLSVEDFLPDRIRTGLQLDKAEYVPGEKIVADIQADNLFGTPAAGRNYQIELNLQKETFSSRDYSAYRFNTSSEYDFSPDQHTGETNSGGHAAEAFGLSQDYSEAGILRGTVAATVFDETGRPVHRYAHFTAYTQPAFIGVKKGDDYVSTRQALKIPLVALDKSGKPVSGVRASVTVLRRDWNSVLEESYGSYRYQSKKQEKTVLQEDIVLNGSSTSFSFTPMESGDYEFRISPEGSGSYVSKPFYAWGAGDSRYTSFAINTEGQLDIQADKAQYRAGESMKLLFTTPFDGRMLVTLERDHIQKYYYLNTTHKSASLTIRADDAGVPNVYVTATLFRPMDGTEIPLTVAHGFQSIAVLNPANRLPLSVNLAAASRSKTRQMVTVKTAPGAFVTIAAVDEGILQVKNYSTPDPHAHFYQKVALTTASYDLYPLLLPELRTVRSSTGGDESGDGGAMRVNPMFVNRARLVSFWSGVLQADGSGTVRYPIDVPQFSGDIRVMAMAWKGKAFAGTDQHMKVADPIVISAGLPRVLSPSDEVKVPVTLSNTTTKTAEAVVSISTTGPLAVAGIATQRISIPAGRGGRAVFSVTAQTAIGAGKVLVKVVAFSETFSDETEIGIRPPVSLQKLSGSGTIASGNTTTVRLPGNFIPATATGRLIVGSSPLLPFTRQLAYLVQYPHGCVEQTISTAFPQLYYADLVRSAQSGDVPVNTTYNVQQAINKIQSMQLPDGGLRYWPGGGGESSVSWWGSVYGAHFLLEARRAGFAVNDETLRNLLKYLLVRLQKRETTTLYYNNNQQREIAAKEIAYSLYVLALAGQPQVATMNYYKGNAGQLAVDSRYLLAAAYTLSGQTAAAKQVLPTNFGTERAATADGGSFYSYVRDQGVSLAALLDADPGNAQIPELARILGLTMQQGALNTQEAVWGYLALGKLSRRTAASKATTTILVAGKAVGTTTGAPLQIDLRKAGGVADIKVAGGGPVYYYWESTGITADGSYKQEDKNLEVRRKYFDRGGKPFNGASFRQNDLIIVRLSLRSVGPDEVQNVAVTDMLPAGFEVENTRLNDLPGMGWIKDEAGADYLDYRDDRLNLYTTATTAVKHFYYMVRAVSPGTYKLGPVQADAMYNAAIHSYHGAGSVVVGE